MVTLRRAIPIAIVSDSVGVFGLNLYFRHQALMSVLPQEKGIAPANHHATSLQFQSLRHAQGLDKNLCNPRNLRLQPLTPTTKTSGRLSSKTHYSDTNQKHRACYCPVQNRPGLKRHYAVVSKPGRKLNRRRIPSARPGWN